MTRKLVGWRYWALIGTLFGGVAATIYPVAIDPWLHPEKWQEIQKNTRAGVNQESIQPGGMRVWSNPFEERDKK